MKYDIEVTKQEIDNAMLLPGEYRRIGDKYYIPRGMLGGYDASPLPSPTPISVTVKEAVRKEREIWKLALRAVRCILPDDAADVEEEAKRIRMGFLRGGKVTSLAERIAEKARKELGVMCFDSFYTNAESDRALAALIAAELIPLQTQLTMIRIYSRGRDTNVKAVVYKDITAALALLEGDDDVTED